MDSNTLSLYLVAGIVSVALSALMWAFAYMRPEMRLMKSWALANLILAVGFIVSGFGPYLPPWATVIGTNVLLIAAFPVIYTGVRAFFDKEAAPWDRTGWAIVALTIVPFWYWGLVQPDGHYRAAVYSFAVASINARTTHLLLRAALQYPRKLSTMALAALFGASAAWMLGRGLYVLMAEPAPAVVRGANPTTWVTVAWYIVLVSLASLAIFWTELSAASADRLEEARRGRFAFNFPEYFRNRLHLLWVTILILSMVIVAEGSVYYTKSYEWEEARLAHQSKNSNAALAQHSLQVFGQVDTLLFAVRSFYLKTHSLSETEQFINTLRFDKSTIDNVYLIDASGKITIAHDPEAVGRSVSDRDYFEFLKGNPADSIFIGSVESGRVTGKFHFRVARRINTADGRFSGVLLCTVNPESFSRIYRNQADGADSTATLVSTIDRKVRARSPELPAERWPYVLESPIWDALAQAPTGVYKNTSAVDGIRRVFSYQRVGDLPLVMVTGFSESDIRASVYQRLRLPALAAVGVWGTVLALAWLLTIEIRRRQEQDRFLSMLSHELKTPLSTIGMTLGNGDVPDGIRHRINRSIRSMTAVIDRCVQSDRLAHGKVEVEKVNCNVATLLNDARTASIAPERVQISADPATNIHTDPQLLSVIVSNLIDNALKYGNNHTPVLLRLEADRGSRKNGLRIVVNNAPGGAGVPDSKMVFKKYYRAPGAHGKTGSGLGLHISDGFATMLGGQLRYVPTPDAVEFALWIPQH